MEPHPKNPHILVYEKRLPGPPEQTVLEVGAYAWPGGYPIFYLAEDNGVLCPKCVEENLDQCIGDPEETFHDQWKIVAHDCNWEDPSLYCDHCGKRVESAYAEPEEEEEEG